MGRVLWWKRKRKESRIETNSAARLSCHNQAGESEGKVNDLYVIPIAELDRQVRYRFEKRQTDSSIIVNRQLTNILLSS